MLRRWLSLLDHVRAYPLRELPLAAPPVRHRQHGLHHFFLRRLQPVTDQLHEDRHGQERDPLVAIPVRVIVRQALAVRGGQRRHIRGRLVVPSVPRRIPFSVSTANAWSPASRCNRSAISLGSVVAIEPSALRRVTSLTIRVSIALLCYSAKRAPDATAASSSPPPSPPAPRPACARR